MGKFFQYYSLLEPCVPGTKKQNQQTTFEQVSLNTMRTMNNEQQQAYQKTTTVQQHRARMLR
jgi:flagellar hook-basal body complex protein FliE